MTPLPTMKHTLTNLIGMLYDAAMKAETPIRRAEYFRHMERCVAILTRMKGGN